MSDAMLHIERRALPGATRGRLFFAQVREDPALEIAAIEPRATDNLVVVSSGGCTALSLLAAGAGNVVAVDLNATQNDLVDLKAVALTRLPHAEATAFLGARPASPEWRLKSYRVLRVDLTPAARKYWDQSRKALGRGVIQSGVSERFAALLVRAITLFVHGRSRQRALLGCRTLEAQRELYERHWNTWRWRAFFATLMNRSVFRRTYHPAFFAQVANPSFSRHFLRLVEHSLTRVPVGTNYFLHQLLTGHYPEDGGEESLPLYLTPRGAQALRGKAKQLTLVDGSYLDYLGALPDGSITGFAISNICEWMTKSEIDRLFEQIVRTAAPGATLVFRNFVGWTEVPPCWRSEVVERKALGEELMPRDRSMVQRRIAVCTVRGRTLEQERAKPCRTSAFARHEAPTMTV